MTYIKHPEHGNKHVPADEAQALTLEGWVIWPRTKAQKAGIVRADSFREVPLTDSIAFTPEAAPTKRAYVRKAK